MFVSMHAADRHLQCEANFRRTIPGTAYSHVTVFHFIADTQIGFAGGLADRTVVPVAPGRDAQVQGEVQTLLRFNGDRDIAVPGVISFLRELDLAVLERDG